MRVRLRIVKLAEGYRIEEFRRGFILRSWREVSESHSGAVPSPFPVTRKTLEEAEAFARIYAAYVLARPAREVVWERSFE